MVLCGVAGSAPAGAAGGSGDAGHGSPVSTLADRPAPPVGIRAIAYYRAHNQGAVDARAELRDLRAARRDAMRTRLALAEAAVQGGGGPAGVPEAAAASGSAVVAGATAGRRAANRVRSTQAARPKQATPRTGPARQRTTTPRVTPRTPKRATTPRITMPAVAGGGGGVVGFALAQVGKAYGFGSSGPDRFDCSGLVAAAYGRAGVALPHQTGGLARVGRPVGRGELRPGDLVFPAAGHVGIYIGGGRMVHASTERGGVKISPIYAFSFARRIG
ncbi:C40 family peptidase [Dactylosporangium sp. NPDC005555]|uniref:C40 family peptidase n=1 Tax=Dactylosporangium sp. NPDC005555 TaxID=3154889 RepID=UPI0033BEA41C